MAPVPVRQVVTDRSATLLPNNPQRVLSSPTYSFAQQLPAPLTAPTRTRVPCPSPSSPSSSSSPLSPQPATIAPTPAASSEKTTSLGPRSVPRQPPASRWAVGLPKAATAAEVVANSTADAAARKIDDAAAVAVDPEMDLYSRLVPATTAVPRNPRRPLATGGLRGTGSIASGTITSPARNALQPSGAGVGMSGTVAIPSTPASNSGPGSTRSLSPPSSRMQSLSSEASPAQLARRATASQKQRRSASPEIAAPAVPVLTAEKKQQTGTVISEASTTMTPALPLSPSPPPLSPSSPSPSSSHSSTHSLSPPPQPTTPASSSIDTSHSVQPNHRIVQPTQLTEVSQVRSKVPEPIPYRREQIESLRSPGGNMEVGAAPSPASVSKKNSPVPVRNNGVSAPDSGSQRKGSAATVKPLPLPHPQNARADAMREAMLAKSPSPHSSKSVMLTRSTMGSSLTEVKRTVTVAGQTHHSIDHVVPESTLSFTDMEEFTMKDGEASSSECPHHVPVASSEPMIEAKVMAFPTISAQVEPLPQPDVRLDMDRHASPLWNGRNDLHVCLEVPGSRTTVSCTTGLISSSPYVPQLIPSVPLPYVPVSSGPTLGGLTTGLINHDYEVQSMSNAEMLVQNLVGVEPEPVAGSLGIESLSLNNIMVGLYGNKSLGNFRVAPVELDPAEDGLLPPLPNSEQEGARFENMLRSMGWQPLDDEDTGFIGNMR